MTVHQVPYYQIECNYRGCQDAQAFDPENPAWADQLRAEKAWAAAGGLRVQGTPKTVGVPRHYCPTHAPSVRKALARRAAQAHQEAS